MTTPRFDMRVDSNIKEFTRDLDHIERRQIPFATASSLTKTMKEAQQSIQKAIPNRFNTTKKWWLQRQPTGIKVEPATKNKLWAEVYTNAHFAKLQEEGGIKTPHKGSKIAIPSTNVKTRRLRRSGGAREATGKSNVFFAQMKSGKTGIFRRRGKNRIELMYTLDDNAKITPVFGFTDIAILVVNRRFERNFFTQLDIAIKTAR